VCVCGASRCVGAVWSATRKEWRKKRDKVEVRVQSLDYIRFTGEVSRFTDKVNNDTRTMITEIEVPNPNLELVPGMYAAVVLKVEQRPRVLTIPIEAASIGDSTTVCVVNSSQEIEVRAITLGLETASRCEVISGLKEGLKQDVNSFVDSIGERHLRSGETKVCSNDSLIYHHG